MTEPSSKLASISIDLGHNRKSGSRNIPTRKRVPLTSYQTQDDVNNFSVVASSQNTQQQIPMPQLSMTGQIRANGLIEGKRRFKIVKEPTRETVPKSMPTQMSNHSGEGRSQPLTLRKRLGSSTRSLRQN